MTDSHSVPEPVETPEGWALITALHPIPPTTKEIIKAVEDGHSIEAWIPGAGQWVCTGYGDDLWISLLAQFGDQSQPGFRIVEIA